MSPIIPKNKISNSSDSVIFLPELIYDKRNIQLRFNLNYVFSLNVIDNDLGEVLFLLKANIMDQISHNYASHVSRIGITNF